MGEACSPAELATNSGRETSESGGKASVCRLGMQLQEWQASLRVTGARRRACDSSSETDQLAGFAPAAMPKISVAFLFEARA